jgi:glycosyltransferase involved in cell wall biosynthesis
MTTAISKTVRVWREEGLSSVFRRLSIEIHRSFRAGRRCRLSFGVSVPGERTSRGGWVASRLSVPGPTRRLGGGYSEGRRDREVPRAARSGAIRDWVDRRPRGEKAREANERRRALDLGRLAEGQLHRDSWTKRRLRVLHLVSRDPDDPAGGADHHARDLGRCLEDAGCGSAYAWVVNSELKVLWGSDREFEWSFGAGCFEEQCAGIAYVLGALQIGVIHAHDLMPFERSRLARFGVPLVISLHDFQLFCFRPHLMESTRGEFCNFSRDRERCARCLATDRVGTLSRLDDWRTESVEILREASALIAPSNYMARSVPTLFRQDNLLQKTHVITPGSGGRGGRAVARGDSLVQRVVFLGQFHAVKGSRVFADLVRLMANDSELRFAIVGNIVDRESLAGIRRIAQVETSGRYRRRHLGQLLDRQRDVVVLPSVVPESYSYCLTEALASGLPVLAFDLGALGERLRAIGADDFVVKTEEGAAGFARRLRAMTAGLLRWPAIVPKEESKAEFAKRHVELYAGLIRREVETARW